MILVHNYPHGDLYAFPDLAAYEAFARSTQGKGRNCWEDEVYDVGTGGQATSENQLDLYELKLRITSG